MTSFHSATVVFSVWFFKHKDIFFILAITHIVGTAILLRMKVDCVFFSKCAKQNFCFIGNATVIIRGVFRTLPSNGFYLHHWYLPSNGFYLRHWYFTEFYPDHDTSAGNKAKGRISKRVFQESKARQNICFSEILACFAFLKHPFWDSPFCLITDDSDFF